MNPARSLAVEPLDGSDVWPLVVELLADLNARYAHVWVPDADENDRYLAELTPAAVAPPAGAFVVARVAGRPVACGAVRATEEPGLGEVKRMFVRPPAQGRGHGRAVLARLEAEARRLGYRRLRLETGVHQPEAMGLYRAAGWVPVAPYGPWTDQALSRCFGKEL